MRSLLCLLILWLLTYEPVLAQQSLPYRLIYPLHYNKHKRYPLVLFLHGAGQRGNDNESQLKGVPNALTDTVGREKYPCFILAPQCPKNDVWVKFPHFPQSLQTTEQPTPSAQLALAILDSLLQHLPIDKKRVYITGYSMGGEGAFDFLTRRPKLFAAAIPVCSVADTSRAKYIAKIPIWAFHGDADDVNDVKYSRLMIAELKKYNGQPKYTEYPGVKHNSWMQAYGEKEVWEWMWGRR